MKFLILVLAAAVAGPAGAQEGFMLAYSSHRDADADLDELYLIRPDGSRKTRLTFNEGNDRWPEWSADGRHIYYWSNHHRRTTHIWAGDIFRMTLPDRSIEQITLGLGNWDQACPSESLHLSNYLINVCTTGGDWARPTLSPTGDRLAVDFHDYDTLPPRLLFFVDIATGFPTPVLDYHNNNAFYNALAPRWSDEHPSWSPDGRRIAFASDQAGHSDIFVMNADGSAPSPLTNSPFGAYYPNWSPDGAFIAYVGASDAASYGNLDIYVMDSDGRENRRLTTDRGDDLFPAWSPVPLPESFLPSAVEVQSWGAIKKAWRR